MPSPGPGLRAIWRGALSGAAALACLVPAAAQAERWSISGVLSQGFRADSNLSLDTGGEEASLSSTTTGNVSFASQTPTSSLRFTPGFRATTFLAGDGRDLISPSFSSGLSHRVGSLDLSSSLSLDIRQTVFSEIGEEDDTGFTDLDVLQRNATAITVRASAGAGYQINSRNRFNLGSNVSLRRFTDDADSLSPSTTIGLSGGYSHSLDNVTAVSLSTGLSRTEFTGQNASESVTFSFGGGVSTSISPGFSLGGQFGLNFTDTTRTGRPDSSGLGFSFSTNASYAATSDTSLSFNASQSLQPGANGELQDQLRINLGVAHSINDRENVSFSLGLSQQSLATSAQGSGSSTLAQSSLGYRLAITPDLNALLSYSFRVRPSESLEDGSHALFLTFSKAFTIQN